MFLKEKIIFSNSYFPKKSPIEAQDQVCPKKSKIPSPIVSNSPHLKKIQVSYAKFATLKENKVQIRLKKPTKNKIRSWIGKFSNPKSKSKLKKKIRTQCRNRSRGNLRKVNLNPKPKSKKESESTKSTKKKFRIRIQSRSWSSKYLEKKKIPSIKVPTKRKSEIRTTKRESRSWVT